MSSTLIADILFTKIQQRVLVLLYGKPDSTFYTSEIMRYAGMGRGAISRELENLSSSGLLSVLRRGNQFHYQANKENPIYSELVKIIRKTFAIADLIKAALLPVTEQIEWVFVYSSVANCENSSSSDIHLLIVSSSLSYVDVIRVISEAEELTGRPISPSIYTVDQIKNKLHEDNAFVSRVMEQPKIWIKGDENDIRDFR